MGAVLAPEPKVSRLFLMHPFAQASNQRNVSRFDHTVLHFFFEKRVDFVGGRVLNVSRPNVILRCCRLFGAASTTVTASPATTEDAGQIAALPRLETVNSAYV